MTRPLPTFRVRVVHLVALWAYAVSQPIFSMLDANPAFLVVRGSTRLEILLFAVAVVVAVPLAAALCEWIVSRVSRRASDVLHVLFLGAFTLPLALHLLKRFDPGEIRAVIACIALSAVAVAAYVRWTHVRAFLTVSILLPSAGLLLFVTSIPVVVDDAAGVPLDARPRIPVVLVVFDELPVSSLMSAKGQLDEVRYPNFARLARSATWYPRTTTVHNHTAGAVPAILSGAFPAQAGCQRSPSTLRTSSLCSARRTNSGRTSWSPICVPSAIVRATAALPGSAYASLALMFASRTSIASCRSH